MSKFSQSFEYCNIRRLTIYLTVTNRAFSSYFFDFCVIYHLCYALFVFHHILLALKHQYVLFQDSNILLSFLLVLQVQHLYFHIVFEMSHIQQQNHYLLLYVIYVLFLNVVLHVRESNHIHHHLMKTVFLPLLQHNLHFVHQDHLNVQNLIVIYHVGLLHLHLFLFHHDSNLFSILSKKPNKIQHQKINYVKNKKFLEISTIFLPLFLS